MQKHYPTAIKGKELDSRVNGVFGFFYFYFYFGGHKEGSS